MHQLTIAGKAYRSRLLVGTGKYKDFAQTRAAIDASGAEIITVAIRRTNIGQEPGQPDDVLTTLHRQRPRLRRTRPRSLPDRIARPDEDQPVVAVRLDLMGERHRRVHLSGPAPDPRWWPGPARRPDGRWG